MRAVFLAAACMSLVCACIDDERMIAVPPEGDLADFSTYVQPVLSSGCASLDCHGQEGRPLRLFAKDGLRLADDLRGQDPTDEELRANMEAIAGLDPQVTRVQDHLILRKPLAIAAGGIHHVGGELWADQTDPSYRCLHAWLRAGASDEAGQAVCRSVLP